ncbi:MAG TPA: S53 family peptidase [Methylocystis sp.]|nr:S53 family peptidase [Methylocystis sp.]
MGRQQTPSSHGPQSSPAVKAGIHSYVHYARPRVKPYFKLKAAGGKNRHAASASWNVPDLCAAYNWPTNLAGGGVIAIVELGGGWVQSDIDQFFGSIGQPSPQLTDVSVDGTKNAPNPDPGGPDGEVALDIEVAGAAYYVATGKPAVIRIYWAQDIATAVRAATADGCDVCSISWGADEAKWGPQAAEDMEQAATDATAAGMIVFAASGDNDSGDGGPNPANVDVPSSCPHVIGCGGTSKTQSNETVWNNSPGNPNGQGTGGGFSKFFKPMPPWQLGAPHGRGRMVPDVAANADPETGYNIFFHGTQTTIGGTSAVAPLYAGLFASFGQKLGFVTPTLWENQLCFNDITQGDNGQFRAEPGPDPCTGIGSPIGVKIAALFAASATAPGQSNRLSELEAENRRLQLELDALRNVRALQREVA